MKKLLQNIRRKWFPTDWERIEDYLSTSKDHVELERMINSITPGKCHN